MTSLKKVGDAALGVPLNHYAKEIQSIWNPFYELGKLLRCKYPRSFSS